MNPTTILAIIGTLATIVLGGWGIYLAVKRRYPGRITFIIEDSIGLFDSIVRNLPELAVLYKGESVRQNLSELPKVMAKKIAAKSSLTAPQLCAVFLCQSE